MWVKHPILSLWSCWQLPHPKFPIICLIQRIFAKSQCARDFQHVPLIQMPQYVLVQKSPVCVFMPQYFHNVTGPVTLQVTGPVTSKNSCTGGRGLFGLLRPTGSASFSISIIFRDLLCIAACCAHDFNFFLSKLCPSSNVRIEPCFVFRARLSMDELPGRGCSACWDPQAPHHAV